MVSEEIIKNSFLKMKEHMLYLQHEITILKQEIKDVKQTLSQIQTAVQGFDTSATDLRHSTHTSTDNIGNYPLKPQDFHSSIGNEGVSTDRQQTFDRRNTLLKRTSQERGKPDLEPLSSYISTLKKDLQDKFKTLTKQEFLIFSVLYTLSEETENVTYKDIAKRTALTESSVRDYISRLEHKGIPIIKEKLNNRMVILKIPRELKDLTTLDNLSKLNKFTS